MLVLSLKTEVVITVHVRNEDVVDPLQSDTIAPDLQLSSFSTIDHEELFTQVNYL